MNWLQQIFSIKSGTDYANTASAISENISIKGTNVWLMICSALLASIGLDTNSSAIIIGAMLISPLMSPILGVGYGVGVQDRELFIRSIRNLAYGAFFSLLTAVLYFLVTPLGEPTSEILARTQPTLLDIGVAFFGGVAGIVSGSRKEKTNAIPGVAIATALMPPICASGFGLATGRWDIFGGAFYLFFINAVFISLSTYLFVKLLKFPIKSYVEGETQRKVALAAWLMVVVISLPSLFFLYTVYQKNRTYQIIQREVIDDFHKQGNEILKWETEKTDSVKMIKAFYSGIPVSDTERIHYDRKLADLGLGEFRVRFVRMNLTRNEMDKMSREMTENIMKHMELQNTRIRDSLQQLYSTLDQGIFYDDVKTFYPNVHALGVGPIEMRGSGSSDTIWSAHIQWDSLSASVNKEEAVNNISQYLRKKLKTDTVWIYQTEQTKKQ